MGGHGGHGGLNILFQKKWHLYNCDNREKVKRDEEAAAQEEQLKRDQARKRDGESRLEKLRLARGLAAPPAQGSATATASSPEPESKSKSNHLNLFEGIKIFDPVVGVEGGKGDDDERRVSKKMKMTKKEAPPRVVPAEDEMYRMVCGVAGKGVKLPWYFSRPSDDASNVERDDGSDDGDRFRVVKDGAKSSGKKTVEQLREERVKREKREKERERALVLEKRRMDGAALKEGAFYRR